MRSTEVRVRVHAAFSQVVSKLVLLETVVPCTRHNWALDGHHSGRYNPLVNDVILSLFGDEQDGPAHAAEELPLFRPHDAIDVDNRWLLSTPRGACPDAERAVYTGTRGGIVSARRSRKLFNRRFCSAASARPA